MRISHALMSHVSPHTAHQFFHFIIIFFLYIPTHINPPLLVSTNQTYDYAWVSLSIDLILSICIDTTPLPSRSLPYSNPKIRSSVPSNISQRISLHIPKEKPISKIKPSSRCVRRGISRVSKIISINSDHNCNTWLLIIVNIFTNKSIVLKTSIRRSAHYTTNIKLD